MHFTNLYLLEFFVEKAHFENVDSFLEGELGKKIKLCLSFQFLQYPPMEVCQEAFLLRNNSTLFLKQGKSCLFASKDINKMNSREFKVKILVSQTDLEADERKIIGLTVVEVGSVFLKGKGIRGEFPLKSESGERFGYLSVFLSLTSWGEKIVTRFQCGGQNGDFMFKGTEVEQTVEDSESRPTGSSYSLLEEELESRTDLSGQVHSTVAERKVGVEEIDHIKFESRPTSEEECSIEGSDTIYSDDELAEDDTSQLETKNYKEIEVSINNHLLRIKVMRDKDGRIVYDNGDGQMSDEEKRHSNLSASDEVTAKVSDAEPVQEPGVVQIKGDRILLEVPESALDNPNLAFESPIYKFKSGKKADANVITFSQSADAQMEFGTADRQQETFLMVIKNNRHDSKVKNSNRLDLELRTRKQPEPKPAVDEKNTQYEISDVPASSRGKSKKGNKNEKGGKSKKGKKM
ncbi:hypothetical protein LSTR_LSTR009608 [Laodelphax striatellus]|uniref:Uncharacterized protein n=1 Tax=Laodelphax striatellus TaxID=195883 RepID=A0A482WIR7_LAOST|nr:hypothetical protein LSTR_LSTR009608 [Laodelphax striatellus]